MTAAGASGYALFWAGAIAVSILIYVTLDGFDLGVGILFATTWDRDLRTGMIRAIAPFWDGNETWLIVIGASLFAAFPVVYAVFLPAFYHPVLLLLCGLIFRGVAFEFRGRGGPQWLWDWGFGLGSGVATFVQGAALGALMGGIPVEANQYAGDAHEWLRPLALLCGVGLVIGYALLGACWLVLKSESSLRDWAYRRIPWLVTALMLVLGIAAWGSLAALRHAGAPPHARMGAILPALLALLAIAGLLLGARRRRDGVPFAMAVSFFAAAFFTLGTLFWPYMIPYTVTVATAAAPQASLAFLFWGAGLFVLPVIGFYTAVVYWLFRGKARPGYG